MTAPAEKVGRGACPICGEPVMFKKSSGGKLTYACDSCDTSGYAHHGGTGFAAWAKSAGGMIAPEPDKAPPQPAPAGFSFGAL